MCTAFKMVHLVHTVNMQGRVKPEVRSTHERDEM